MSLLKAFDRDVLMADGRTIRLRPVRPSDAAGLRRFFDLGLSDTSSYLRFFGVRPHFSGERFREWATLDLHSHVMMVAERDGAIVAAGSYDVQRQSGVPSAEVAFAVLDELHRHGLATLMLEDVVLIARAAGLRQLTATTLGENKPMRDVFRAVGLPVRTAFDAGLVAVELDISDLSLMGERAQERERLATAASVRPILAPRSVVVIGASSSGHGAGAAVLRHLSASFNGTLYVVHPVATTLHGVTCLRSVADLADGADLAVIAVPAEAVCDVIEACGVAAVGAAVVISAGFSEQGHPDLEHACLRAARRHGMRLVGPNCLGVLSTSVGLDAIFSESVVRPGSIALASQSGGLGIALLDEVGRRGAGISSFVSLGNKADVSGNDLLSYWRDDPTTSCIALYLESFGNGRRFARVARDVSLRKPIVAIKAGRSAAGARGATSHTAAVLTPDIAVGAALEHAGVLRVDSLEELIDLAVALDLQPLPRGRRVAVIGNAGGPLILAVDAAETAGLEVPVLSDDLRGVIHHVVPGAASTANPIDLLATATADQLVASVEAIAASGEVDAVVIVQVPLRDEDRRDLGVALEKLSCSVTLLAAVLGPLPAAGPIPTFRYPESAVRTLRRMVERHDWLELVDDVDGDAPPIGVAEEISSATGWLPPDEVDGLLVAAGLTTATARLVTRPEQLPDALAATGIPAVMKVVGDGMLHKTELDGVRLGIADGAAASATFAEWYTRFGGRLDGVLVQRQIPAGVELIIGVDGTSPFGSLVMVGAGGTLAELLDDRAVLLAPFSHAEAAAALDRLRCTRLLRGFRGSPELDVDAVVDVLVRIGQLAAAHPEIAEADLNPVIVTVGGPIVVDARVRLEPRTGQPDPVRAMRGV